MPVHLRSITGKVDYEVEQVIRDLVLAANQQEADTLVITEEFRPQITQLAATVGSLGDLARVSKVQSDSITVQGDQITNIISSGVTVSGLPVDNQVAVWVSAIAIEGDAAFTWDGAALAATVVESTVAPGTAPLIVASTTLVANLNVAQLGGITSAGYVQTSRLLTAGVGLLGGGDLSADRTFTVDLNELPTEASIAAGDFLAMVDITDSGSGKVTVANLGAAIGGDIDHGALLGLADNDHPQYALVGESADEAWVGAWSGI